MRTSNPCRPASIGTLAFGAEYPGFFLGYLGDEETTRAALRGGYFVTSDLARMDDDGYVFIVGRADDCFKSKGVLIAPRELEDAILGLGEFEEACVFPIPDREIGNRIGAALVPRAGADGAADNGDAGASARRPHRAVQAAAPRGGAAAAPEERQRQDAAEPGRPPGDTVALIVMLREIMIGLFAGAAGGVADAVRHAAPERGRCRGVGAGQRLPGGRP